MPGMVVGSSLSFVGEAEIGAADAVGGAQNERLVQDMILVRDTGMRPEDFTDNFNDNIRDEARWKLDSVLRGTFNPAHTVAEVNQQMRVTVAAAEASGNNGYSSLFLYNFTGSLARVELVEAPPLAPFDTGLLVGPSVSLYATMRVIGGVLFCRRTNPTVTVTLEYDPLAHHHFRIRHEPSDNTFRFDTSPDGLVWTERASHSATAFAITAVRMELVSGKNGVTADPGIAVFDNFNTTASQVYPFNVRDTLFMPDTAAPTAEHPREVLDRLLLGDQARQEAARVASILDRLLLSDQTRQQADRQARVQDALLLSDAQRRIVEAARAVVDALVVSDRAEVTADRRREILDALLVSDLFTAEKIAGAAGAQVITRLIQDALLLADVYRREQAMVVREAAGLADAYVLDRYLILRDRVELLGEISQEALRLRAIVDLISTMDATSATALRMRLIADAVPLADAVRKVQEMIIRTPISVVDSVTSTLFETILRILTGIAIALVDPLGRNRDIRFRDPLARATGDRTQAPFVRAVGWRTQP